MTIEVVIFDLDNTLVNRKLAFRKYSEQFTDQFVVTTDPEHRAEIIEYIIEADRDGYRKKRELYEELFNRLEMKKTEVTVDTLVEYWFSEFFKCTVLMDGAREVLQKLKSNRLKLGLITNGSEHSQNSKLIEFRSDHFLMQSSFPMKLELRSQINGFLKLRCNV